MRDLGERKQSREKEKLGSLQRGQGKEAPLSSQPGMSWEKGTNGRAADSCFKKRGNNCLNEPAPEEGGGSCHKERRRRGSPGWEQGTGGGLQRNPKCQENLCFIKDVCSGLFGTRFY